VGHGISWFEGCFKGLPLTPQVIGDTRAVNSCFISR
jgi:hypothetical protein